jgi:type IV secretion system protein VirB4
VINEAFDLLENPFFAPRLESMLEMLKQKNVMVVFTTNKPQACNGTVTLSALMAGCATKIYIPDDMPVNYKSDELKLNDQDDVMLSDMQRQKGDFLLKQNGESIVLKVFMEEAEDAVAILSNDIKALGSARGKFTGVPKDY